MQDRLSNLFEKILAEVETIRSPGLHHISVAHDDWCDLLAGRGACNCDPIVKSPVAHSDWTRRN
jgi:hypothetical protein